MLSAFKNPCKHPLSPLDWNLNQQPQSHKRALAKMNIPKKKYNSTTTDNDTIHMAMPKLEETAPGILGISREAGPRCSALATLASAMSSVMKKKTCLRVVSEALYSRSPFLIHHKTRIRGRDALCRP